MSEEIEISKDEFYCPALIDNWRSFLRSYIDTEVPGVVDLKSFRSNLCYTLQYLEYTDFLLKNQALHASVITITYKSFVVFGASVLESILFYAVGKQGFRRRKKWDEFKSYKSSNSQKIGDIKTQVRTILEVELDEPLVENETLSQLIQKVLKKDLIPTKSKEELYKDLTRLRKLRNKIHLYSVEGSWDTDWNSFTRREFYLTKKVLFGVLSSQLFDQGKLSDDQLDFLEVGKDHA